MDILRKHLPSPDTLARFLGNLTRPERDKKPGLAAFYLTFGCNARCDFCSQGEFVHGDSAGEQLEGISTEDSLRVLEAIRRDVPSVYFLGGEPTVHPELERVLEGAHDLGFDTIGVNTNGVLYRPEILEWANLLVVSLHSLDPDKIAEIYGIAPKFGQDVLMNVVRYAAERDKSRVEMTVNCVVTGDNLADVREVAEFCKGIGVRLNVAPAILDDGRPDERLRGNAEYHALIDWLAEQRGLLASSRAYLRTIRDFEPFACTPQVMPCVYPNGDVAAPCPPLLAEVSANGAGVNGASRPVNLFEAGGLTAALQEGRARFEAMNGVLDTRQRCAELCHKTCYIEAASLSTLGGLVGRVLA